MTQAVRSLSRFAPVELPVPASKPHTIATDAAGHLKADVVHTLLAEDDPRCEHADNGWMVRQHDKQRGALRESTDLYATADQASDAYWTGEVRWEAWVSPLFATPAIVAEAA